MNRDPSDLLRRLRDYSFDDPDSPRPFSRRLAQEQGWNAAFTARAIEEYLRFVVLTQTADHPVCPSDEVDEVWHLHLLYTRNYWGNFCHELLGGPLHHEPSRGGRDELARHRQMYAATLDAYRRTFGAEPPADLWPDLASRFAPLARCQPADPHANRRGQWRRQMKRPWPWVLTAGAAFPLLAAVDPGLVVALQNPFDLRGVDFLLLYGLLFLVAVAASAYLRTRARRSGPASPTSPLELDPYEMAYLAGGMRRTINTAVAELVRTGSLSADNKTPPRFTQSGKLAAKANPFEQQVYHFFDKQKKGSTLQTLQRQGETLCLPLRRRLQTLGLIVAEEQEQLATRLAVLIFLTLGGIAVVKIGVGIARDRPVSFLIVACIASVLIGVIAFNRRLHRTPLGDRELGSLQNQFTQLRDAFKQQGTSAEPINSDAAAAPDLHYPLILGLFGLDLLAATPHSNLAKSLGNQPSSWITSSGCSSGCGGSGCGGGGCGGGCGGCGGGD